MCKIVEDRVDKVKLDAALSTAKVLLKMGKNTLDEIAEASGLPLEKVKALAEENS